MPLDAPGASQPPLCPRISRPKTVAPSGLRVPGGTPRARQSALSRRNSGIGKEHTMRMLFCALAALCAISAASADDTFRIAVGQRGLWDTSVVALGQRGGIFKKHGITLDILYTQGGGETQQAVISGGVELGVSAGSLGVFGAFAKGAPLHIIGAEMTGGGRLCWYVRPESSMPTLAGTTGPTVPHST